MTDGCVLCFESVSTVGSAGCKKTDVSSTYKTKLVCLARLFVVFPT